MFFGALALMLIMLSFCFFLPVLFDYMETGKVARFPTLIVCGFTVVAAIQSFFTGLMLQTMVQKNKQDFEARLTYVNYTKQNYKGN
jgi:hypothetical protein